MRHESLAEVVCSIGQRIGDDIPGNAPLRRVIKGRNLASKIEGMKKLARKRYGKFASSIVTISRF
jgi:hypothetical protein